MDKVRLPKGWCYDKQVNAWNRDWFHFAIYPTPGQSHSVQIQLQRLCKPSELSLKCYWSCSVPAVSWCSPAEGEAHSKQGVNQLSPAASGSHHQSPPPPLEERWHWGADYFSQIIAIQYFTRKHVITGQALGEKKVSVDFKSQWNAGSCIFSYVHLEEVRCRLTLNRNNAHLSPWYFTCSATSVL